MTESTAIDLRGISKSYPGVRALDDVDFSVRCGEIHALLGENGAGKSTLVGVMSGTVAPDSGAISISGVETRPANPHDARAKGINLVPQDLLFVPELSIGRNILLGIERGGTQAGRLSAKERRKVQAALDQVGAAFKSSTLARALSPPELRLAQVARALVDPGDVIILDEPTAVLAHSDAEHLLERLMALRENGKAIVYVSHRLSEVMRIADRITVLRDGRVNGRFTADRFDRNEIIRTMGREGSSIAAAEQRAPLAQSNGNGATEIISVRGLALDDRHDPIELTAREGEIVAVVGVQGSGHGRLLRACAGVEKPDQAEIVVDGDALRLGSVQDAVAHGVLLVPADRRNAAIAPALSVAANIAITSRVRRSVRRYGLRVLRRERAMAREYMEQLGIRAPSSETQAGTLSGGNQQKLALSRVIEGGPRVLMIDEPTQGIDVRTKQDIRNLLVRMTRDQRCAVVIATSEFEDALGLADVIHVMRLGSLVATLDGDSATYGEILEHALP